MKVREFCLLNYTYHILKKPRKRAAPHLEFCGKIKGKYDEVSIISNNSINVAGTTVS